MKSLMQQYTVPEMLSPQKANWGVRIGRHIVSFAYNVC